MDKKSALVSAIAWPVNWIKRHWKLTLGLLVVAALLGYWQYQRLQAQKPELTFTQPYEGNLTKTLEITGVVDAKEKARLRFLAGGKVVYLGAQEGEWVKKWQTIATIDRAALKKQLEQDLNTFMKERLDWDQTIDDVYEDVYTTTEERIKEKAQLDLTNEVLDVEIRDIAIRDTALYAPFAGVVTKLPTNTTGVQLLSTDYFEIVNPETLLFVAYVDEVDMSDLEVGQPAVLRLDAYPDEEYPTRITYIAYTSTQSTTGTVFAVEFPLDQADLNHFRLGMNGDVAIELAEVQNTLIVPLEATRERDGVTYVDVRTGEYTFEERAIEVGLTTDDEVEVLIGLQPTDEIVLPE